MSITLRKITRGLLILLLTIFIILLASFYKYELFYAQEIRVDRKLRFLEMKNSLVHPFFNTGTVKEYKNYGRGSEKIICLKGEIIKRVRFYENGKIWCKVPIKYCSYHGVAKHYFENGQVQYEIEYTFGVKNGKAREYYSNGQIKKEFNFEQNLLHGTFVEYDSIGNVLLKEKYQQDKKVE